MGQATRLFNIPENKKKTLDKLENIRKNQKTFKKKVKKLKTIRKKIKTN